MSGKYSSNDKTHPYLRGYLFWKDNRFWRNGLYSKKTQNEYDEWVESMRMNDRQLTHVDGSITNI